MKRPGSRGLKTAIGLVLGFAIGAVCRLLDIPSPAPSVLPGAMLVIAMTVGYSLVDRWRRPAPARSEDLCAGPSGVTKS